MTDQVINEVEKQMSLEDFEQLARSLESSEEFVHAIADVLKIEGSDVTEENIVAVWNNPTSEQLEFVEKRAMLFALENGLEIGDEMFLRIKNFCYRNRGDIK